MAGGAPIGNTNSIRGKIWSEAIKRALDRRPETSRGDYIKGIDQLADKLVDAGMTGDIAALKELGDRLEGKPHQSIDASITAGVMLKAGALDGKA